MVATGTELRKHGIKDCIPDQVAGCSLRKAGRDGDQKELFRDPISQPSEKQKRLMLGLALSKAAHKCMSNHFYSFDNTIYRQSSRGAIGSELTGEVFKV